MNRLSSETQLRTGLHRSACPGRAALSLASGSQVRLLGRGVKGLLAALLVASCFVASASHAEPFANQEDSTGASIADLLARLESGSSEARSAAFTSLVDLGPPAALAATGEVDRASMLARRVRALLLVRVGEAESIPRAIEWLSTGEADAEVRRSLLEFLARADLADAYGDERARVLSELAQTDSDPQLIEAAIASLASFRHPGAGRELDRLVDELPEDYRAQAAQALANTAVGRAAILRRVRALSGDEPEPPADVLSYLISAYGWLLADEPTAGEVLSDIAPIVVLSRHVDERVRLAARVGLENLVSRIAQNTDPSRCAVIYDALEEAGWNIRDLEKRRAVLALRFTSQPGQALESAQRVQAWAKSKSGREATRFRFFGHYLEAAALAASGRPDLAEPHLVRALDVVDALSEARVDLLPEESKSSDLRAQEATDYAHLGAMVELMRAVSLLLSGKQSDDLLVLETLKRTHRRLLIAQLTATRLGVDFPCDFDAILEHELGPRRLLYDNPINPDLPRERALEVMHSLGRAVATVARTEMPGFEPFVLEPRAGLPEGALEGLVDPLEDPERFALLLEYQYTLQRRLDTEASKGQGSLREQRQMRIRSQMVGQNLRKAMDELEEGRPRQEAFAYLARERNPSQLALWLARDLRLEGRPVETRELAERMLEDLRESGLIYPALESEIELVVASSYTEEDRPEDAEDTLLGVLDELETLVKQLKKDRATTEENEEHELVQAYDDYIQRTELRLADCLVSLAVNANVRMGAGEKALAYFERAFEINQSDFMRALLACYRARSGRMEEARVQLREVSPAPALYYNMACTFALMGEPNLALEFLQRDFEENQQSRGTRERQKQWAGDDPDLASLRGLERFQELVRIP